MVRPDARRALRGSMLLVPAGAVIGLGNLAFGAVVGRIVGSALYGAVGSLLVAGTIASLAALGTLYEVARTISRPGGNWHLSHRQLYSFVQPWLFLVAAFAAFAIPLQHFLRLSSVTPVVVACGLFLVTVLSALPQGMLVGSQRFVPLAAIGVATALLKIALGEWFPRQFSGVTGALVAATTATTIGCLGFFLAARRSNREQRQLPCVSDLSPSVELSPRSAFSGGVLATLLWSSLGIPLIFARHVLPPETAGAFVVTQALASAIVFVVGPIATAFFPAVARSRQRQTAMVGLLATAIVAFVVLIGLLIFGPAVVGLVYGSHFVSSRVVFATTGISAVSVSLLGYWLWVSAALNSRLGVSLAIPAALAVEVLLVATWHPNPTVIGIEPAMAVVAGSLFASLVLAFRSRRRVALATVP